MRENSIIDYILFISSLEIAIKSINYLGLKIIFKNIFSFTLTVTSIITDFTFYSITVTLKTTAFRY